MAPSGLYARLCQVFLVLLSSLMISRREIISRSAGPIFAIFTSNESFLAVDDRSGPLFSISQYRMSALIAALIALHRVKMVKIGSVVYELNRGRK